MSYVAYRGFTLSDRGRVAAVSALDSTKTSVKYDKDHNTLSLFGMVLAIGLVVSFVVALGVVEWFLLWVRRHGFVIFAIYRIILGSLLLAFSARFAGA